MEQREERMAVRDERLTKRDVLLFTCAVVTLAAALGFGVAGFIVSPTGEVHDSVLWLIAQLLLFTASAFGLGAYTNITTRDNNSRFTMIERQIRNITSRNGTEESGAKYEQDEDITGQGSRQGDER